MASLATSIFHKHPRLGPISPPDTDTELGPPMQPTPISRSTSAMFGELDHTFSQPPQVETPTTRLGRVSTLTYHHSGHREPQERPIHKSSKSLVVIIPPESFSQEHGQLGHTLSSGPRNRLSHGILMPLFPTMYAQLTAIAREFNFPSTLGLCLYLQISDSGITATPRISDDSWQFLWGQFLDGSNPGHHGLPISGRIEFDIDLSKARWYPSWISASRRDTMLSHTPSMSHSRGDSRTVFVDDQVNDVQQKNPLVVQPTQNLFRHIPKKLSLLSRPTSRSGTVSPEAIDTQIISTLSPIVQDDEPLTAKQELETRVNSWRATTSLAPTHGTQTSDPKTVSADALPVTSAGQASPELNLDDFTWSVSSAGPSSERLDSPLSCERLPSVHLDRRLGSVCLTPSVCTSFGRFDYDLHSPMTEVSCLPSLDIAHRMIEDCPPTPTTATSWGAPLSYPPSPLSEYQPPSIHLDRRGEFSRPTTPTTATSWGAPLSWPTTPLSEYRAPSVDMGERNGWSRPVTPLTATTWGPPMSYPPTPITPFYVHTPDTGQHVLDPYETLPLVWNHVWPYHQNQFCIDSTSVTSQKADEFQDTIPTSNYPHLKIYPDVYPYYDLYPAVAVSEVEVLSNELLPIMLQAAYPALNLYPACYPYFDIYPVTVDVTDVKPANAQPLSHPGKISPPNYPDFGLYPNISPSPAVEEELLCLPTKLHVEYPYFDLYPAVYPYYDLYPAAAAWEVEDRPIESLPTMLQAVYPALNIYPACYPHFDIYPVMHWMVDATVEPANVQLKITPPSYSSYLDFNLLEEVLPCPSTKLAVEYPYFDLYPAVYPNYDLYPAVAASEFEDRPIESLPTMLQAVYPALNIYPACYPHFDIYPIMHWVVDATVVKPAVVKPPLHLVKIIPSTYSTYPEFNLYPDVSSSLVVEGILSCPSIKLAVEYPFFDLYPSVYPFVTPYLSHDCPNSNIQIASHRSELDIDELEVKPIPKSVSVVIETKYPTFNIYPAVYPSFEIYPSIHGLDVPPVQTDHICPSTSRDAFPVFDIHPAISHLHETLQDNHADILGYPVFNIYPAIYLYVEPYPAWCADEQSTRRTSQIKGNVTHEP